MNNKNYIFSGFILVLLCVLLFSCGAKKKIITKSFSNHMFQKRLEPVMLPSIDGQGIIQARFKDKNCTDIDHFYYDPEHPEYFVNKEVRVNFHFVNSLDSSHNYKPDVGVKYAKELLLYANRKLRDNKKMKMPAGNETPVYPVPYRYVLTPDGNEDGDDGIYFHYLENPFFVNGGRKANNYDRKMIDTLAVNQDSVLNIFYMVHHPDSVASKTYIGKEAGIALGKSVKLGINFDRPANSWSYSGLLNHEIGHVFGLSHAWTKNDGCDDTPQHPNCWNKGPAPCDKAVSNNVMDYNSVQMAFTPCQIARAYRTLTRFNSNKRDLTIKEWCRYNPDNDLVIQDTVLWNRTMEMSGNITIANGGMLIATCRLNMAEGSYIKVQGGGGLILHSATLFNECDYIWNGIITEDSQNNPATIEYIDTFYLENVIENIL